MIVVYGNSGPTHPIKRVDSLEAHSLYAVDGATKYGVVLNETHLFISLCRRSNSNEVSETFEAL